MRRLFVTVVFALALAGCGGGKNCSVISVGATGSIPGVCQVIATCPGEPRNVEVDCSLNGEPCTCSSSSGARNAAEGTTTCGPEQAPVLLKLCGFES